MKNQDIVPIPLPEPAKQAQGHVDVGDGHQIWYFDTGGTGTSSRSLRPLAIVSSAIRVNDQSAGQEPA
jgi:hypothetical protein